MSAFGIPVEVCAAIEVLRGASMLVQKHEHELAVVLASESCGGQATLKMLEALELSLSRIRITASEAVGRRTRRTDNRYLVQQMQQDDDDGYALEAKGTRMPTSPSYCEHAYAGVPMAVDVMNNDTHSMSRPTPVTPRATVYIGSAHIAFMWNADLLEMLFGFDAGQGRTCRKRLGELGLVCKRWREVSLRSSIWRQVATDLLPMLGSQGCEEEVANRNGGFHGYIKEYGRALMQRNTFLTRQGGEGWAEGLCMSYEIFDARDGLRLISALGPMSFVEDADEGWSVVRITGPSRREVTGVPLSAAERDPGRERFRSMTQYFTEGHKPEFGATRIIRVSVIDERTGKMALVWESGKSEELDVGGVDEDDLDLLPGNAFEAFSGPARLGSPGYFRDILEAYVAFVVTPVPGQDESVPEKHLKWMLAGADVTDYRQHDSFVRLYLKKVMEDEPITAWEAGDFFRFLLQHQ